MSIERVIRPQRPIILFNTVLHAKRLVERLHGASPGRKIIPVLVSGFEPWHLHVIELPGLMERLASWCMGPKSVPRSDLVSRWNELAGLIEVKMDRANMSAQQGTACWKWQPRCSTDEPEDLS